MTLSAGLDNAPVLNADEERPCDGYWWI